MKEKSKDESYSAPELTEHGSIAEITGSLDFGSGDGIIGDDGALEES